MPKTPSAGTNVASRPGSSNATTARQGYNGSQIFGSAPVYRSTSQNAGYRPGSSASSSSSPRYSGGGQASAYHGSSAPSSSSAASSSHASAGGGGSPSGGGGGGGHVK